jgi:hypothetical protein
MDQQDYLGYTDNQTKGILLMKSNLSEHHRTDNPPAQQTLLQQDPEALLHISYARHTKHTSSEASTQSEESLETLAI